MIEKNYDGIDRCKYSRFWESSRASPDRLKMRPGDLRYAWGDAHHIGSSV